MREAFLLFWVLQQLTSCFSSMGSQFYFTEGEMTNIFSLNLDERYGASFYSVNTTTGNLTQPIELVATVTVGDSELTKISMNGSQFTDQAFSGSGYAIDSLGNIYSSFGPFTHNHSIPIPSFSFVGSVTQPKKAEDFKCFEVALMAQSLAVLCSYSKYQKANKLGDFLVLYVFGLEDEDFSSHGTVFPLFGGDSFGSISLLYNGDNEIFAGLLFVCVPSSYIQVFDVRDPKNVMAASVIDYTLDPSIYPIGLKTMGANLVVLSQNQTKHSTHFFSVLSVGSNLQFSVESTFPLENSQGLSSSFIVRDNFAFIMTHNKLGKMDLMTGLFELSNYSSEIPLDYQVCGSSSYMNFIYLSDTEPIVKILTYFPWDLSSYSQNTIQTGNARRFKVLCDPAFDVLYVYHLNAVSILSIGKPVYMIENPVNETIKITAETLLEGGSKSVTTESFSLQQINQKSAFNVSELNQTTFSLFTGGSFTLPFLYSDIIYGSGLSFSAGPSQGFDYNQKASAFPLTSVSTVNKAQKISYNTDVSSHEYQFTIEPSNTEMTPLFQYLQFIGSKRDQNGYQTVLFGCSAGGSSAENFYCIAKNVLLHEKRFKRVLSIKNGFIVNFSDETFSAFDLHAGFPYLNITVYNGSNCVLLEGERLICIDQHEHIEAYQVAGSDASDIPVYFLNETFLGKEIKVKWIKESKTLDGIVAVSTSQEVQLFNFSANGAQYVSTVTRFHSEGLYECLYFTEQHMAIKANNTIHTYEHTKNKGGRSIFLKKYSYNLDNETKVLGPSENTFSVYMAKNSNLLALKAGESLNGANNPILLDVDFPPMGTLDIINFKGMDLLINDNNSSVQLLLVYPHPLITVFPELKDLDQENYYMPLQITIRNSYDNPKETEKALTSPCQNRQTGKAGNFSFVGQVKEFNLDFYLRNSRVNFTVSKDFLENPNFNFRSGSTFDVEKAGVFSNGTVLFIYLNASNEDDVGTRFNFSNPIEQIRGSYLPSNEVNDNIVDISQSPGGPLFVQAQKSATFFKVSQFLNGLEFNITIDGVKQSDTSFYCMKGDYDSDSRIAASACHAQRRNYVVFYEIEMNGKSTRRMGQVELKELSNQPINDFLFKGSLMVVQGIKMAFFYNVSILEGTQTEEKSLKWSQAGQEKPRNFEGNEAPETNWRIHLTMFQGIENMQKIEGRNYLGSWLFLLFSSSGSLVLFQFDVKQTNPWLMSNPHFFFEDLSKGYNYFENYSSIEVHGHSCNLSSYVGMGPGNIYPRCVVSSSFGETDIGFEISTQKMESLGYGLYGVYKPFGTFLSTGQMLHTANYFVTIVKRPSFWVESAPQPQNRLILLVYKRAGDEIINQRDFSADSCIQIAGGIPGTVFLVDYNDKFLPLLYNGFPFTTTDYDQDRFYVSTTSFNKLFHYQITGQMKLTYKFVFGEILSKNYFFLKAFNDFGTVSVEKLFDTNSISSWIWTGIAYAVGGGVVIFLWGFCWGASFIESKLAKSQKEKLIID